MTTLPLTYYAQFRDASGTLITGTDGQSWFAVTGVKAGQEATLADASGAATSFDPLGLMLGTDAIDPVLLEAEAAGRPFSQIEVAGYAGAGTGATLVTDDVYKTAAIVTSDSTATGLSLALHYADTVHRFYPAGEDGSAGMPVVGGYNKATNKVDTSTQTVTGAPGYAPDAPLAGVPPSTDTTAPLTFYVQFRTAGGTPLASASGQQWFAATGLSVAASQVVNLTGTGAGAGAGAGAGRPVLGPLSFTLDGAATPLLLAQEADGAAFSVVEVAGYDGTGATASLVEDFLDKGAIIASLATVADGSETVALKTTDLVQTVTPSVVASIAGGAGAKTEGWNTTTNQADSEANGAASPLGTPATHPAVALTYDVQFRNASGNLLSGSGGQTSFAASDLGFGVQAAAGGTAGLTPLSFTLAPDGILVELFANQASSVPLQDVELTGYDSNGTPLTGDTFTGAVATTVQTNADGSAMLTYAYHSVRETASGTNSSVQQSLPTGNSIDAVKSDSVSGMAAAMPGDAASTSASAMAGATGLTYYVQFQPFGGGAALAGAGGATWFAVTGVDLATTEAAATTADGDGGKIDLQGLSFTLGADTVLPTLFEDEAAGIPLRVELAGYAGTGPTATLVQDDLATAAITGDTARTDGSASLSLGLIGLQETAYTTGTSGQTSAAASYGVNATDKTIAARVHGTPAVATDPGSLTYYVQFKSYGGGLVKDANGSSWFAVTDLGLPTSSPMQAGAGVGAGAGAGRVSFGDVSFRFADPTVVPQLFLAECQGTLYQSLEIAGYSGSDGTATLVQDDVLTSAAIATLSSHDDTSTSVGLAYGALVERSYAVSNGTNKLADVQGWDRTKNASDSPGSVAPSAALVGTPAAAGTVVPLSLFVELDPEGPPLANSIGDTFLPVSNVTLETTQTLDIGSQSSGAGAGKVTFDPLTFTLAPDSVSATLLDELVSGAFLTKAYLLGYDTTGAKPLLTVSDEFEALHVAALTTNADGSETVSLEYGALGVVATTRAGGTITSTAPAGWDRTNNESDAQYTGSGASLDSLPNSPACYCPGTRIATPAGQRAVEDLVAGDLVLTTDGRVLPVVWVGRRSYTRRFIAGRRDILPITIRAGALADGIPARDLTVSPEHAMLLDGLLIPARCLVNGSSVTQAASVSEVRYLHIELPQHEAILAEGAAAESFVDDDSRGCFHNAGEYCGPLRHGPAVYCAPRIDGGYELEAIRTRLAARARRLALVA